MFLLKLQVFYCHAYLAYDKEKGWVSKVSKPFVCAFWEHWRVLFLYYRCLTVTLPVFTASLLSANTKVCCQYSCFVLDHIWLSHNCTSNFWTWTSLLLFCSSKFAGIFQQGSATFIRTMSNVFSCFLSGTGPLKHLFLSVSLSLLIVHWTFTWRCLNWTNV